MENKCSTFNLLYDGSVHVGNEELNRLKEELASKPVIERLLHPEVRYEVTNRCNATCIMCPRDKHDRAQGNLTTKRVWMRFLRLVQRKWY